MRFSIYQKLLAYFRIFLMKFKSRGALRVGGNVYLGKGSVITGIYSLDILDDVYIGKNVTIEVEGVIGCKTIIGNNVGIVGKTDHDFSNSEEMMFDAETVRQNRSLSHKTIVGSGVWLGYGCVVLSGVKIGDRSIVAAGSVVTRDIPEGVIVAGNPAKIVRKR